MTFGHDGDGGLGDRLVAAVLRGDTTATSSLLVEHRSGDEPLPRVGELLALTDRAGRVLGVVETTGVAVVPMDEVGDDVARDEGEGFADAGAWRRAHEACWRSTADLVRADAGDPAWELRPDEPVVVERFRLVEAPPGAGRRAPGPGRA